MTDAPRPDAIRRLLAAVASRGEIALRLEDPGLDRLLRSVVDAAAALFDAEAASIALVEPDGTLRFRVAAGAQGAGVVGVSVAQGEGIAGFVVATAQPIAIANVADDPRFDREAAARTGYLPRSLLAVPLEVGDRVIGVLEVLDRRGAPAFDLHDVAMAGVFAHQAATAIEVSRVERDVVRLIARGIAAAAGEPPDDATVDQVAHSVVRELDPEASPAFWSLVDRLAVLRAADAGRLALVADLIETAARHLAPDAVAGTSDGGRRRSWRDRAGPEAG